MAAEAPDTTVRVRLTVAYDGSGFHGFAPQPDRPTVAGALAGAIERVVGAPVRLTCAGRTDAGVHAWGQVVHADLPAPLGDDGEGTGALDPAGLARSCTALLGPAIVVREARVAPPGFDARRSALSRRYRYSILAGPSMDPLLAGRVWHVADRLDRRALAAATDPLLGEHDFAAFCKRPPDGGSLVRRVLDARWSASRVRAGELLAFDIEAGSFCHQMVRSVVGTLVEVGRGRRRAGDLVGILGAGDRSLAGPVAPPEGLCLWAVRYPEA
ncbi:MAG TPA: tRNA pseudouridine(38-40) synthase TruA [Acidimicrobiales bacterium]|nr:tRNA pseudouridine(38-40) synthase TruA [Acidimicrobiales bacterium]